MVEKKKKSSAEDITRICMESAEDRKAENIVSLKVTELSTIADYFVLCTAGSAPHIKAVASRICRDVRENTGIHERSVEGTPESQWLLIDFGNVIVHIFTLESRERYQLETLWADAPSASDIAKLSTGIPADK